MDKINKKIIIIVGIVIAIIAMIINSKVSRKQQNPSQNEDLNAETEISEVILDECTDEYENMKEEMISTNFQQEKISPNCKITLTKYYKMCKDEINEYIKVPDNLVNCTQEELQNQYKDWEIKEFSNDQVILYKEFDEMCGQHYILKDEEGKIFIYKILENGEEELYEKTDVSTDYLPEEDMESIKNGLKVNGKEKLNELIESFE